MITATAAAPAQSSFFSEMLVYHFLMISDTEAEITNNKPAAVDAAKVWQPLKQ
jgi:hypothetical protein